MENIEHYFDWAATSPADEDILTSSLKESMECWANPSSGHTAGKKARENKRRKRVQMEVQIHPNQIQILIVVPIVLKI